LVLLEYWLSDSHLRFLYFFLTGQVRRIRIKIKIWVQVW